MLLFLPAPFRRLFPAPDSLIPPAACLTHNTQMNCSAYATVSVLRATSEPKVNLTHAAHSLHNNRKNKNNINNSKVFAAKQRRKQEHHVMPERKTGAVNGNGTIYFQTHIMPAFSQLHVCHWKLCNEFPGHDSSSNTRNQEE